MTLEELKLHMRITHSMEDDLIKTYKTWAEEDIKESVTSSENRNNEFFENNAIYDRAVTLLTAYFYESRYAYSDVEFISMPDGVLSAIQKLRGAYHEKT